MGNFLNSKSKSIAETDTETKDHQNEPEVN